MADSYHVNPKSGEVNLCSAVYSCPFGDLKTGHFAQAKEARQFFESTQETFSTPPKKKDKIYRIGTLEPQTLYFADLDKIVKVFDNLAPEGRQSREGALFASPDMASHLRWVKGAEHGRGDKESRELSVDPRNVYVYPISVYERASLAEMNGRLEEFQKITKEYWDSGMTLTEWRAWAKHASPPAGEWEILLPPTEIIDVKPVSSRRMIEAAPKDQAKEINWILEPKRASKGLIWRKDSAVVSD